MQGRRGSFVRILVAATVAMTWSPPAAPTASGATVILLGADVAPGAVAAGPDGNLWFLDAFERATIGRITPDGGITLFSDLPAGSRPTEIVPGPDGNLWFADPAGNAIGRITPAGVVTRFSLPARKGGASGLVVGPDGNLWFTEPGGNTIGRITPAGVLTAFPLPRPNSLPFGLIAGPDGNLWFLTGFGPATIGRITPDGGIAEFPVPPAGGRPSAVTAGPDGNLWFSDPGGGTIGRITPAGVASEFPLPAESGPSRLAAGPDGNLWFTVSRATGPRLGWITPDGAVVELATLHVAGPLVTGPGGTLAFTEEVCASDGSALTSGAGVGRVTTAAVTRVPLRESLGVTSGAACVHLIGLTTGPDSALWFTGYQQTAGLALAAFIGRLAPSEPPPVPALSLTLDRTHVAAGQTLRLTAILTPGTAAPAAVDAYVVAQLPGGGLRSLQEDGRVVPGVVPIARGVIPESALGGEVEIRFTGVEAPGTYQWLAALAPAGSLDHVDLIGAVAQHPFTVRP
jgi:streptogramin lyase